MAQGPFTNVRVNKNFLSWGSKMRKFPPHAISFTWSHFECVNWLAFFVFSCWISMLIWILTLLIFKCLFYRVILLNIFCHTVFTISQRINSDTKKDWHTAKSRNEICKNCEKFQGKFLPMILFGESCNYVHGLLRF